MAQVTVYTADGRFSTTANDELSPVDIARKETRHELERLLAGDIPGREGYKGGTLTAPTNNSSSTPSTTTEGKTTTRTQVYTLLPWLQKYGGADANTLVDSYVSGYNNSGGSAEFALAEMRFGTDSKDAYSRVFANIVDPNTGALKMSESEYISGLEKVLTTLTAYGLNGYASQNGKSAWARAVANNTSAESYAGRVKLIHDRVINRVDDELQNSIINSYNEYFTNETGTTVSMGQESLLALAIDPNISEDVLKGRLNASELGAVYTGTTGDALDLEAVQRLTGAGVTTQQSEKTFATASATAKALARMQRRQRRDVTLGKAMGVLEAQIFGDEAIASEIQNVTAQNLSGSSVQSGAAKSQTGSVIGLTQY